MRSKSCDENTFKSKLRGISEKSEGKPENNDCKVQKPKVEKETKYAGKSTGDPGSCERSKSEHQKTLSLPKTPGGEPV